MRPDISLTPGPVPSMEDGPAAAEWLASQGLPALEYPHAIRSSDYHTCRHDPFRHYLSRRLLLKPPLEWSEALNRGTWFHHRLGLFDASPLDVDLRLSAELERVTTSIRERATEMRIRPDKILEREKEDVLAARTWYDAACSRVPISKDHGTLQDYLTRSCWEPVGRELLLVYDDGWLRYAAQCDLLLLNRSTGSLWIVDAKTCSCPPRVRLSTCPVEFQTLLYLWVLASLHKAGVLTRELGIPRNTTIGGMIHAAVLKCPLRFGREDRPFHEFEHTLERGPRKGQVEVRRSYTGEPDPELFHARQMEWYTATGRYLDRRAAVAAEPPVNLSFSYYTSTLDRRGLSRLMRKVRLVAEYAACEPWPCNFDDNADSIRMTFKRRSKEGHDEPAGGLTPYAPFYLMPLHYWPSIVKQDGFIRIDRDALIPPHGHAVIRTMENQS